MYIKIHIIYFLPEDTVSYINYRQRHLKISMDRLCKRKTCERKRTRSLKPNCNFINPGSDNYIFRALARDNSADKWSNWSQQGAINLRLSFRLRRLHKSTFNLDAVIQCTVIYCTIVSALVLIKYLRNT